MRVFLALGALLLATAAVPIPAMARDCRPGTWIEPATGTPRPHDVVLARAAAARVVLLGETHDDAEHHRWQLSVLAGLLALEPGLAVGFEALPRRAQPALERWRAGELDEAAFLAAVDWRRVWNLPADLYLPLFNLVRLYRLPILGLNVERRLVARIGREGWAAIPTAEREGVGDPAAPTPAYVDRLAGYFRGHGSSVNGDVAADPGFRRFVEAQLVWDRAMAEALAGASRTAPLVVGILGSEHVRHREGVPHQLRALGVPDAAVLLPHEARHGCAGLEAGEADAMFVLRGSP